MADKRIKISSIQIKNFRSIRNVIIKATEFNILVGTNDVGKSNVLKALNLFFNGQTDYNKAFSFENDFTYLFPEKSHSTKEIKITITFEIPDTYSECGEYTWTKIWRTNNYFDELILNKDGEKPNALSRVPGALKRIKYRYVPAVKSQLYYKTLLGDLYSAVAASLGNPLLSSATAFSEALKAYTHTISEEVSSKLHMSSELTVPSDLNDIFQALIFETCGKSEGILVPLSARGDGIQAKHIPIILHYIALEDQKSRRRGSMKVCTIWGFEEPENGLELARAFKMADEFEEYAKEIQIFTTTHSPAFYMKKENDDTKVFYVSKHIDTEATDISIGKTDCIIDNMGLMPLVAPFIADQQKVLCKAQEIYQQNMLTDTPTIMVEGPTDVAFLTTAINVISTKLKSKLDSNELRIVAAGGTTQVVDWAFAWIYSGFKSKMFILLDKDDAGSIAKQSIEESELYRTKQNSVSMRIQTIQPSDAIIALLSKNIKMQFEIEHLLSTDFWKKLKIQNWVEPRSDEILQKMFTGLVPRSKTLDTVIDNLVDDVDVRDTILTFVPKDEKKTAITRLLQSDPCVADAVKGFEKTIQRIEAYF